MIRSGNLFAHIVPDPEDEQVSDLAVAPGARIERIVSFGQTTPEGQWFDQDWTEWVVLVRGRARIRFEGEAEARTLAAGDWLEIGPHIRHRVEYTDQDAPTIWLAVHFPAEMTPDRD
jgi:cupin 2 domain-containing protein